jgi:hypothetical protein
MNIEFTGRKIPTADGGLMFEALVDGKSVICTVSMEALNDHFGVTEDVATNVSPFDRGQAKIYAAAERLIRAGVSPVFVTSEDLH